MKCVKHTSEIIMPPDIYRKEKHSSIITHTSITQCKICYLLQCVNMLVSLLPAAFYHT